MASVLVPVTRDCKPWRMTWALQYEYEALGCSSSYRVGAMYFPHYNGRLPLTEMTR